MRRFTRFLLYLPFLILSPLLILIPMASIGIGDFLWSLIGRKRFSRDSARSLFRIACHSELEWPRPAREVSAVRRGGDGRSSWQMRSSLSTMPPLTAALSSSRALPGGRVLALPENLGFGGGSNAGFRAAKNDIVVLLNSDMRVEPDFLQPLLDGFTDERVFAVSCQIFFSDPTKLREETGLTQAWWQDGGCACGTAIDDAVQDLYPCFYGGGGSLRLRPPQVSRAWRLRPAAASVLSGRHRPRLHGVEARLEGAVPAAQHRVPRAPRAPSARSFRSTTFSVDPEEELRAVLLEEHPRVAQDCSRISSRRGPTRWSARLFGDSPERSESSLDSGGRCCNYRRASGSLAARHARGRSAIREAFRRPLGGYFRDRFEPIAALVPEQLSVLFVSPYPICPPTHGGGVFMYQTLRSSRSSHSLHLIVLLDFESQRAPHDELAAMRFGRVYRAHDRTLAFVRLGPSACGGRVQQSRIWSG